MVSVGWWQCCAVLCCDVMPKHAYRHIDRCEVGALTKAPRDLTRIELGEARNGNVRKVEL